MENNPVTLPRIGRGTVIVGLGYWGVNQPDLQTYAWFLAAFVFFYDAMVSLTTAMLKSPKDGEFRRSLLSALEKTNAPIESYRLLLNRVLNWIDKKLGDDSTLKLHESESSPRQKRIWSTFPFSLQSYVFLLRAALIYPIGFLVISLLTVGYSHDGSRGAGLSLFGKYGIALSQEAMLPFIFMGSVVISGSMAIWCRQNLSASIYFSVIFAIIVALVVAVDTALAGAVSGSYVDSPAVLLSFATTLLVVTTIVLAFALLFNFMKSYTSAGAFGLIVVGIFAIAYATLLFFFFLTFEHLNTTDFLFGIIATLFVGYFAFSLAKRLEQLYRGLDYPAKIKFRTVEWPLIIAVILLIASLQSFLVFKDLSAGFIPISLVLLYLPLVNVAFDFASFALTRGLLRHSLSSTLQGWQVLRLPLLALAGLFVAIVTMVVLVMAMVIAVGVLDYFYGSGEYSLKIMISTLSDYKKNTKSYWIYATIFSTLVPTLVHFAIGSIGLALGILSWFTVTRNWAVEYLEKNESWRYLNLRLVPSFVAVLAVLLLVIVVGLPVLVFSSFGLFDWFFHFLVDCAWVAAWPFGYSPPG